MQKARPGSKIQTSAFDDGHLLSLKRGARRVSVALEARGGKGGRGQAFEKCPQGQQEVGADWPIFVSPSRDTHLFHQEGQWHPLPSLATRPSQAASLRGALVKDALCENWVRLSGWLLLLQLLTGHWPRSGDTLASAAHMDGTGRRGLPTSHPLPTNDGWYPLPTALTPPFQEPLLTAPTHETGCLAFWFGQTHQWTKSVAASSGQGKTEEHRKELQSSKE